METPSRMEAYNENASNEVLMYEKENGEIVDLLSVQGCTASLYGLRVAREIWGKEAIEAGLIEKGRDADNVRPNLDEQRVNLFKGMYCIVVYF